MQTANTRYNSPISFFGKSSHICNWAFFNSSHQTGGTQRLTLRYLISAECVVRQAGCKARLEIKKLYRDMGLLKNDEEHMEHYDARMIGCLNELEWETKDLDPINFKAMGMGLLPILMERARGAYTHLDRGGNGGSWRRDVLQFVTELDNIARASDPRGQAGSNKCGTCEGCRGPRRCVFAGRVGADGVLWGCGRCGVCVDKDPRLRRDDGRLHEIYEG
ncbi:hypothetical protein B0T19DRAFT_411708 [Cercophora scortea]|uniref:Uncharacterized protein n=1 Tax=Cercophora scortea TaxID=314031 RepID=A0AAE0MLR7_9PEZI|nr:hypothetical protein B0T19DRAFT_411708 [Cercophora scortea]